MSEQEIHSSFPPPLPEPPETVVEAFAFDARAEPVTPGGPPPTSDAPTPPATESVPPIPAQPGYLPQGYVAPGYAAPGYPAPGSAAPGYAPTGYPPPGYTPPGYAPPVSAPAYPVSAPGYPVSAPGYAAPVSAAPNYGAPMYSAPGYAPPGSVPPGYATSGYGQPGFGGPGFLPPPPPRRKKTWLFVGIGVVVLLLCAGIGAVLFTIGSAADKKVTAGATSHPTATAAPSIAPPPPPDPTTMNGSLTLQAKALVAGDQAGWMAAVDPTAKSAVAEYQRIYHNLRGMKVASWDQAVVGGEEAPVGVEHYNIAATYCLMAAPCTKMTVRLAVTAALVSGRVVIKSITVPKTNYQTDEPFPWLVANLSVMTGPRVIVAASSAESSHLTAALHVAEEAAVVADKFAHWNRTDVYIVYLASVKEAGSWLGGVAHADKYTGTTNRITDTDIEAIAIMPAASIYGGPGGLAASLRWTMGEIATGNGAESGVGNDSLSVGMADYISGYGHAGWVTDNFNGLRSFVRSSKWNKSVYLTKEVNSSSESTQAAARGIGYYAITRMVQKYGLKKTLDFWGYAERNFESLETASQTAFGVPWKTVNADCVAYIKSKV